MRIKLLVAAFLLVLPAMAYGQDFSASVTTVVRPTYPYGHASYTANGSFTVNVANTGGCVGTYTVNAAPVASSGPSGSTPPTTTVTTYIGFPTGNFYFGNAGVGSYTVTVTETSGSCAPAVNPKQFTAVVPARVGDFTASATAQRTSLPWGDASYTANGSFTVNVANTGGCVGTYTVHAAPVAGSGPSGSTPPNTTVTTYIGFPAGDFYFGNAGTGTYEVSVTETGALCFPAAATQTFNVAVPQPMGDFSVSYTAQGSPSTIDVGSLSVEIAEDGGCSGTYDVLLTPVSGSAPNGEDPPASPSGPYTGVAAGQYSFLQLGAGNYTISVEETSGACVPAVNPQLATAAVAVIPPIPALDPLGLLALGLCLGIAGMIVARRV